MRRDDEDGDSMLSSTLSDGGSIKRKRYIYSISKPLVVYVWHYIVEYIVYRASFETFTLCKSGSCFRP